MIYPINHLPDKIPIGIQTEQGVDVIGFDLKPWLDALQDMAFTVWHTRPGEKEAYPVNDHMMVGTVLYWHPDGYDTAIAGDGKVEIAGIGENRRKLSGFAHTAIQATSLVATKEPGESVSPWYEAILQAAQDVKVDVDVGSGGLYLVNTKDSRADRTQEEIRAAVAAGKTCLLTDDFGMVYTYYEEMDYPSDPSETQCPTFIRYEKTPDGIAQYEARVLSTGDVIVGWFNGLCTTPNPWNLVFDGLGVTYNGSKQVRVKIPVIADPADKKSAAYLRWNGTEYAPATVDSVKEELGGGGTVDVDATLTKAGTAADAKAVGDRFTSLSEEIGNLGNAGVVSLTPAQVDKCKDYAARINSAAGKTEGFLFFTDPHFGGSTTPNASTEKYLRQIAEVYNNTPTSMCVCGGDWLNNGNTKENACWQLGVFDGQMKALFDRYVLIIGNHDTNYQGKEYMQSGADGTYDREAHEQCILSRNALVNLWHRKQGASYFVVDGDCTKFYVFDTGLDWYPDMDEYKWEQVDWFANALLTDKPEHSAALLHIAGYSASNTTPFVSNITQIAKAYNARSSVTLNGKGYDFSAATGKFHFILGGHKHEDISYVLNDVVIVMTTNLFAVSSVLSFDLVLVDYAADKIHMVRVGTGNSRTVSLVDGSVTEDGDNGDNGDDVETNLFDMGISAADYVTYNGNPVSDSDLIVNTLDGTLTASSMSGGTRHLFRTKAIENDGTEFRLQGTVYNEVNKTAFWGLSIRLLDDAGEIVTDANVVATEKPKYASDFVYSDYWQAYRMSFGDSMGGNVADIGMRFIIPANVKTFMLGFQFTTPYQGEAGTPVTFKDIILTKA